MSDSPTLNTPADQPSPVAAARLLLIEQGLETALTPDMRRRVLGQLKANAQGWSPAQRALTPDGLEPGFIFRPLLVPQPRTQSHRVPHD